ncbi:MAG TPA: thioredoxin family protein [Calditrichia bacterium]|nr:thioredoxin family protein [Calditrichota bacterium]HQV34280.1 thioredoxin family protein [Calditrichia bacterium]
MRTYVHGAAALLFFLLILPLLAQEEDASLSWNTQLTEELKTEARENGKHILLYFSGSDWCRPCIQLKKKVFGSPAFKELADGDLVIVQLDFPVKKQNKLSPEHTAHNEAMAEKYNPKGAFPLVVVLDAAGTELGSLSGYKGLSVSEYLTELKGLWQKKAEN